MASFLSFHLFGSGSIMSLSISRLSGLQIGEPGFDPRQTSSLKHPSIGDRAPSLQVKLP
jgi:hypothetical protein